MKLRNAVPVSARNRIYRYMRLADAIHRLGGRWLIYRLQYRAERQLGIVARRSPVHQWPDLVPAGSGRHLNVVDRDGLRHYLSARLGKEDLAVLQAKIEAVAERRFEVFGTQVRLDDWHHDPHSCVHYPKGVQWSSIGETPGADLKRVWEPSRFGWAFDLARAHLVAPDRGAAEVFWRAFDEWCDQNPPNAGVNWACGQEASIRLMAVSIAASSMQDTMNEERYAKVQRFAWVTAERVASNIAYARSQQNNHHSSEATGLIAAALLYPGHVRSPDWLSLGETHLREVSETLVLPDGGTSQYSMNYHRVFLHTYVWATVCYKNAGRPVPTWLTAALVRMSDVLDTLIEPTSGEVPFFGQDDGALVLPLTFGAPFENMQGDLAMAHAVLDLDRGVGESVRWFSPSSTGVSESPVVAKTTPYVESFPDFGIHVLVLGSTRVFVRCGDTRFRPGHDDQLHIDLWVNGKNILRDSRTVSYHPGPGEPGSLREAEYHNGPRLAAEPAMYAASRFLWSNWPTAEVVRLEGLDDSIEGVFRLTLTSGTVLTRSITLRDGRLDINDRASVRGELRTTWLEGEVFGVVAQWDDQGLSTTGTLSVGSGYGRVVERTARNFRSNKSAEPALDQVLTFGSLKMLC